ncbi:MAG: hypothetical protein WD467_02275 [Candidatus Saccharimonadales bacterium]
MEPKSVVTCIPSRDLDKSLEFYKKCFQLEALEIEEETIVIELANLSLFVMGQEVAYVQDPDGHVWELVHVMK